jgi:hypothetical protein
MPSLTSVRWLKALPMPPAASLKEEIAMKSSTNEFSLAMSSFVEYLQHKTIKQRSY